ncbi:MAG: DinB family protein [Chloroflexota bacterium]
MQQPEAMLSQIQQRHVALMQKTLDLLGNILQDVSQTDATTYRDGPDGWTTVEVVCHLRDFDGFFHHRAQMMKTQDNPQLPAYDHEQLAIDRKYNDQILTTVYGELVESRTQFITFFQDLTPAEWNRTGNHPERGSFTMTDAVMQVGLHDADHAEQITRILLNKA